MTQPFFFFTGFFDPGPRGIEFLLRFSPGAPVVAHGHRKRSKIAMRIKGRAVGGRIQKSVLIKLALNFNAVIANIAQQPNRDRLIVHIGA